MDVRSPAAVELAWSVSAEATPFLRDHRVAGVPVIPAAYLIELAARAALELRPPLAVARVEGATFERFAKVFEGRSLAVRAVARSVADDADRGTVRVQVESDFAGPDGQVLQRGIVHCAMVVVLGRSLARSGVGHATADAPGVAVRAFEDPYVHPESTVKLGGPFDVLREIRGSEALRVATLRAGSAGPRLDFAGCLLPVLPLDALFRLAAIRVEPGGQAALCVPVRVDRFDLFAAAEGVDDIEDLELRAGPQRMAGGGDLLHVEWAEARDGRGRLRLSLEGLTCRRMGSVPAALVPG